MPRKKIYDIKHPKAKVAKKLERDVKEFFREEKKVTERHTPIKKKSNLLVWAMMGGGVVMCGLAVYLFFTLPKVSVTLSPVLEEVKFEEAVVSDESARTVDSTKSIIPAFYFEIEKKNSKEFSATGNDTDAGKASGVITIFNKYDPVTPFTLKAGTRFMSDSGKIFISTQKVTVPSAKKSGSKITPGSATVSVEAAEGGDGYNISASSFSIPGLKGTAYYFTVFASSEEAMTGGYSGKIKKITSQDIEEAESALTQELTNQGADELKKSISDEYVVLDDAIYSVVTIEPKQVTAGTIAQNFNLAGTVSVKAIAFKKLDVDEFVKSYIISKIPESKTMLDTSLVQEYIVSSLDAENSKINLIIKFSVKIYNTIDKHKLSTSLFGQDDAQIRQTVDAVLSDHISGVSVVFWPFWVTQAPYDQKRITILTEFK